MAGGPAACRRRPTAGLASASGMGEGTVGGRGCAAGPVGAPRRPSRGPRRQWLACLRAMTTRLPGTAASASGSPDARRRRRPRCLHRCRGVAHSPGGGCRPERRAPASRRLLDLDQGMWSVLAAVGIRFPAVPVRTGSHAWSPGGDGHAQALPSGDIPLQRRPMRGRARDIRSARPRHLQSRGHGPGSGHPERSTPPAVHARLERGGRLDERPRPVLKGAAHRRQGVGVPADRLPVGGVGHPAVVGGQECVERCPRRRCRSDASRGTGARWAPPARPRRARPGPGAPRHGTARRRRGVWDASGGPWSSTVRNRPGPPCRPLPWRPSLLPLGTPPAPRSLPSVPPAAARLACRLPLH